MTSPRSSSSTGSIGRGCVRADDEPRQSEDGQRAHAGAEPAPRAHARPRRGRSARSTTARRRFAPGTRSLALLGERGARAPDRRTSAASSEDPARGAQERFRGDHRRLRRGDLGELRGGGGGSRRRLAAMVRARRRQDAEPRLSTPSTSPSARSRERSTPCSAAISRFVRSSTS